MKSRALPISSADKGLFDAKRMMRRFFGKILSKKVLKFLCGDFGADFHGGDIAFTVDEDRSGDA